jgi:hypothetical protein
MAQAFCKRVMTLYFGQDFPAIPAPPPATEDKVGNFSCRC